MDAAIPPLPEPGEQSAEDRMKISRIFLLEAREELDKGSRLQAGEKAWGAVAQYLKIIGEQRGWHHGSHSQVEGIGRHILMEFAPFHKGKEMTELSNALSDAYHRGHNNFYENQHSYQEIAETIEEVEEALPTLQALQQAAPRPFTIESNRQRRRLIELTGNPDLQIRDSSPVGFSLRHPPAAAEPETE